MTFVRNSRSFGFQLEKPEIHHQGICTICTQYMTSFSYSYIIKVFGNKKDMAGETRRSWNYEMFGGSPRRNSQQGGETSHRHTSWLGWASKTEKPNPGMIMVSFYDLLRFYRIKAFFLVSGLSTLPRCSAFRSLHLRPGWDFRSFGPATPLTSTKAGKFVEEFEKLWEDFEPE